MEQNTFQTLTIQVPADATGARVPVSGQWVDIVSVTAGILLGFDQSTPQGVSPGRGYPGPKGGFRSIRIVSAAGGACTATVTISDAPTAGQGADDLSAVAADMALTRVAAQAVNTRLAAAGAVAFLEDYTPGDANRHQVFAANANRAGIVLVPLTANVGIVYVGDATLTVNRKFWHMTKTGYWCPVREPPKCAIYILTANAGDGVYGYEY